MRHVAKHLRIHDSAEGDPTSPGGWKVYAETSHAFIKTFWDVVMDEFLEDDLTGQQCQIDVVVLRRPLYEVVRDSHGWCQAVIQKKSAFELFVPTLQSQACSLYRRNWTRIHADWLIEPGSALATLPELRIPGRPDRNVQEMGAVLWYLHDTEAKAQQFWERYGMHPNVRVHEAQLKDLQTARGVDALFAALDLRRGRGTAEDTELNEWLESRGIHLDLPRDRSDEVIGSTHNANPPGMERGIPCSREFVQERLVALREAAQRQGVELPPMQLL